MLVLLDDINTPNEDNLDCRKRCGSCENFAASPTDDKHHDKGEQKIERRDQSQASTHWLDIVECKCRHRRYRRGDEDACQVCSDAEGPGLILPDLHSLFGVCLSASGKGAEMHCRESVQTRLCCCEAQQDLAHSRGPMLCSQCHGHSPSRAAALRVQPGHRSQAFGETPASAHRMFAEASSLGHQFIMIRLRGIWLTESRNFSPTVDS